MQMSPFQPRKPSRDVKLDGRNIYRPSIWLSASALASSAKSLTCSLVGPTSILKGEIGTIRRRNYTWPNLRHDCKNFVEQCVLCKRNKTTHHLPYGLLQPLPILERPWHSISMDFIEQLPTSNGYTAILVVINHLTKESVFIPTTDNATAMDVADFFVTHVFAKHGIPLHVSSDCSSEFTSHFFRSLGSLLHMRLHFTSGHHPSTNGQVEHTNSTLEQYLHIYCNYQQDNWLKLLPLAEFAYNNAPHASTGVLPFFANRGYDPLIAVYPDAEITDLCARHFAINFNKIHQFLRDQMKAAQASMACYANRNRLAPPPFHVGDCVFIRTNHIRTNHTACKLTEQKIGPFPIVSQPSAMSFTLRLPSTIRIHPVFHVSLDAGQVLVPITISTHSSPDRRSSLKIGNTNRLPSRLSISSSLLKSPQATLHKAVTHNLAYGPFTLILKHLRNAAVPEMKLVIVDRILYAPWLRMFPGLYQQSPPLRLFFQAITT